MRLEIEMHKAGGWWVIGIGKKNELYQLSPVFKRRKDALALREELAALAGSGQKVWARLIKS